MKQKSFLLDNAVNLEEGFVLNPPSYITPGTRVCCLYRVSTLMQVYYTQDKQADIPMQRKACHKFAEQMGWTIVCELKEEGVSGHKVRAENRDKIQLIKEYARKQKFDIFLVFMFDRIGRIADETPFVVEWLVKHGVRVWSTEEGEQRFDNHTDKLTNYLRFWVADGESEKTSIRTSTSMGQIVEDGNFTGGTCPYGYRLVKKGRTNKRKQDVHDLEIEESEAPIVRMMFEKAVNEGYGAQRIANYLNSLNIKNKSGDNWHPATIRGILKNVTYTGVLRSGESRSPIQPHLQIITPEMFEAVQRLMAVRSKKYEGERTVAMNTRGRSLLCGNIFCGCCGARLCVTTSGKGRPNAQGIDQKRMRYTCQTKSRKHGHCEGQTGYTVYKVDDRIDALILEIFSKVTNISKHEIIDQLYSIELEEKRNRAQKILKEFQKSERELQNLRLEVIKAVNGESAFTTDLLASLVKEMEVKTNDLKAAYEALNNEIRNGEETIHSISDQYDKMLKWSEAYKQATIETKKMIITQLIERVDVFSGYCLHVKFRISIRQFIMGIDNVA